MNKILLIIQREYFSRVKKKSFLLVTFVVPVLLMAMFSLTIYLAVYQGGLGDQKKVLVVDESTWFEHKLSSGKRVHYAFAHDFPKAKTSFVKDGYDYLLYIPKSATEIALLGEKTPSTIATSNIQDDLTKVSQSRKLAEAHIDSSLLAEAQKDIKVVPQQITENGVQSAHIWVSYMVGLSCAFLIYISLLLYGAQVMRGVIEEKVSRIIEVIISSVKPFQLMLGKIIGVGMVGLTQFVLWIVVSLVLGMGVSAVGLKSNQQQLTEQVAQSNGMVASKQMEQIGNSEVGRLLQSLETLPVGTIIGCFLFYFLFGYMLYSALFAAVGSAVDNETETQQFMLPVTLPLIFTIMLSQSVIINNPDGALSIWLSMIPLTSPIAMMIRIPFGVPGWQIALSMVLMIGGFLGTTYVASRIYRVGILMYGKKASYKELAKWFMYKE